MATKGRKPDASVSTETQQKPQLYKPGQSGNPAGRPKGSRNKLAEAFITDLQADWEEHGVEVIAAVRGERPQDYLKVVASILPKDLNINVNKYEAMTDEQVIARLRELDAAIRPLLPPEGESGVAGVPETAARH